MDKKIKIINKCLFFAELYKLSWLLVTMILIVNGLAYNKLYKIFYMPVWLILACWTPNKTNNFLIFMAYIIIFADSIIFTIEKICLHRLCKFEVPKKFGFALNFFWLLSIIVTVLYWSVSLIGVF